LGQESAFYNIHVKGMSWLHTDERPTPTMALGVAVSTRGADHLRSRPGTDTYVMPPDVREKMYGFAPPAKITSYEGGGKTVRWHELVYAISDSLGVCKFQALFMSPSTIGYEQYSQMLGHVTGMELSPAQMTEAAERIYTLERMFNNRSTLWSGCSTTGRGRAGRTTICRSATTSSRHPSESAAFRGRRLTGSSSANSLMSTTTLMAGTGTESPPQKRCASWDYMTSHLTYCSRDTDRAGGRHHEEDADRRLHQVHWLQAM
ncbi:MAG: hypothetical protein NTU41_10760, partial [Chloroflexi bacterium]|nr:hypothetical protein [Chloroflexota bacterium]